MDLNRLNKTPIKITFIILTVILLALSILCVVTLTQTIVHNVTYNGDLYVGAYYTFISFKFFSDGTFIGEAKTVKGIESFTGIYELSHDKAYITLKYNRPTGPIAPFVSEEVADNFIQSINDLMDENGQTTLIRVQQDKFTVFSPDSTILGSVDSGAYIGCAIALSYMLVMISFMSFILIKYPLKARVKKEVVKITYEKGKLIMNDSKKKQ